jgi:glycosyltransferase involved in cell wall biosynthesis
MPSLLLVSHRSPLGRGGASARWRSLFTRMPELGWKVDTVCADQVDDIDAEAHEREHIARRARLMSRMRSILRPAFNLAGIQPPQKSLVWMMRGAFAVRARLGERPDVVVATAPPMVALLAARLGLIGSDVPFVVDMRDLWAGNPAFDREGPLLPWIERWIFARADIVIVCAAECLVSIGRRHPALKDRFRLIPNGFEPELVALRSQASWSHRPLTILHSGVLTANRPLSPLLKALNSDRLRSSFRLCLHGYLAPEIEGELSAVPPELEVQVLPPSDWREAIQHIASADVTLVSQARAAGDELTVASKVYEYLAIGKPVLCLTDGGGTETLLKRLGVGQFCARLDSPRTITSALLRLLEEPPPAPVPVEQLAPYDRAHIARTMVDALEDVIKRHA